MRQLAQQTNIVSDHNHDNIHNIEIFLFIILNLFCLKFAGSFCFEIYIHFEHDWP